MSVFTRPSRPTQGPAAPEADLLPPDSPAPTSTDDSAPAPTDGPVTESAAGDLPPLEVATSDGDAGVGARRSGGWRTVAGRVLTAMAALFVLVALVIPDNLSDLKPSTFLAIPGEALLGVALAAVLPPRARRVLAVLAGVALGAMTIVKALDMGFYAVRDRPFDLTMDWILLDDAVSFLGDSIGPDGAKAAAIAMVVLLLAVVLLLTLAMRRLAGQVARHGSNAVPFVAVLAIVWLTCAALSAQLVPGVPFAADSTVTLAYHRARQVGSAIRDDQAFAKELAATDPFGATPGDQLLGGLQGKDVVFAFIESYGRDAVQDPEMAPQVNAVLDSGTARLNAAGYSSRSAFLTSPTTGSGSWLAHATMLSGLWVNNDRRHRTLLASERTTLNSAFKRAGWRSVGVMPGVTQAWPEGEFYGYDQVYNVNQLGYKGPRFSYATMPDQYTLTAFERLERAKKDRGPVMAEIPLVTSHAPWTPLPRMIDWKDVGDGSVYHSMASGPGHRPEYVLNRDPKEVRAEYRQSIEYSLESLVQYVEKFGDKNLVLVFLGDHQPAPIVVGRNANRDVPITIVARDPAVLDKISSWGWQDGLKPAADAPVWRMDTFRDRFLTAYQR